MEARLNHCISFCWLFWGYSPIATIEIPISALGYTPNPRARVRAQPPGGFLLGARFQGLLGRGGGCGLALAATTSKVVAG